MPDVKVAVARFATPTSTGNQDWTTTDLGGRTPKAVIIEWSNTTADGTAAANLFWCSGFGTASAGYCANTYEADGLTTMVCKSNGNAYPLAAYDSHTGVFARASVNSFITNGVRLNFDVAAGTAYLATVTFFAGDDLSAHVGSITPGTQDTTSDITAPGFEPDVVFFRFAATLNGSTAGGSSEMGMGVAVNDGTPTQLSMGQSAANGVSTTSSTAVARNDYGALKINFPSPEYEISDFDDDGFSLTPKGSNGDRNLIYLALSVGGLGVWAGAIDSPTSTGDFAVSGVGFTPQYAGISLNQLSVFGSNRTNEEAGAYGISHFTADAEFSTAFAGEDAVTTSNTQSLSDDTAVHLTDDAGTQTHLAAFSSMDSDGFTLNFSATDGTARKWFGWAIELPVAAQELTPTGLSSTAAFGGPTLGLYLAPGGVPSGSAFGEPTVLPGAVSLLPPSIASAVAYGGAVVTPGAVTLTPGGLESTVGIGGPTVALLTDLYPPGIASALAFGSATVADAGATLGLVCGQLYLASAIGGDLELTPIVSGTLSIEEC